MTIVRKLVNTSDVDVPVQIDEQTTVYVGSGKQLENVSVCNLDSIRPFVNVEQDLSEILPITEKKVKLYD